jgi:hypothetical protein
MPLFAAAPTPVALDVRHQDFWFWNGTRPRIAGVLPIGPFYHAAYRVATSLVLLLLVRMLRPSHLEGETAAHG